MSNKLESSLPGMQEIKKALDAAAKAEFGVDGKTELSVPDEKFGDLATGIAMQVGKKTGKNPREVAILLAGKLHNLEVVEKVEIADPGFINIRLNDEYLLDSSGRATDLPKPLAGQEILVEFGDPNPFKELHIGHLYSYIVGDSISRLLEAHGASVSRLSYHGDVGLQVAQAVYGLLELGEGSNLGGSYAYGAEKYASMPTAKDRIEAINKAIYTGDDPEIESLHEDGVKLSFEEFDKILNKLSIKTDRRYLESQTWMIGADMVKRNIGRIFKRSQGAIIFEGEKKGLHTRVFLTSKGIPTYETKDLGLVKLKARDYPNANRSIIVTAHEQAEYFKVMLAALAEIEPGLADKTTHIYHGFVSLASGKMSSRTGEVYAASDLLNKVRVETAKQFPSSHSADETYIGAVKYALLKHRIGADIVFDVKESVSLQGNSGPYLQYAHARASSILAKAESEHAAKDGKLEPAERSLARKISEYPGVVSKATEELLPSHITNYLHELAQIFNSFYETSRIIGDERESVRMRLVRNYADVLKSGLKLLNISAPDRV